MVDIEKNLAETAFNVINVLRGHFDLGLSKEVVRELLFLKLLNGGVSTDDYFASRIHGDIEFNNVEELMVKFNKFIQKNT
ncbi:TPA: hypothetical protein K8M67_002853, partial [Clostridium perfringens]|nr:hypothetical protein [Clostridium perfringens]